MSPITDSEQFTKCSTIYTVGCLTPVLRGHCAHFLPSRLPLVHTPFLLGSAISRSWRAITHSVLGSYPPRETHPQTTVPRPLVTVDGLRVGHMPQGGSFYMFPYTCREKKVFGGWNCSPGRVYGQTFSHSQEDSRDVSYVYRGSRA